MAGPSRLLVVGEVQGLQGRMVFSLKSCFPLRGVYLGGKATYPFSDYMRPRCPVGSTC